jgi:hypothetical protein
MKSYWAMMTNNMYALFYLNEHFERCVKLDRVITIFLAVAASSAIASWAIWQQFGFVWAVIVAGSQVITVINTYLPYKKRIKQINSLKDRLVPIYNEIESKWFDVSSGKLSKSSINKLHYEFTKKWSMAQEEFFNDDTLPSVERFKRKAEELKDKYFENLFGDKSEAISLDAGDAFLTGGVEA